MGRPREFDTEEALARALDQFWRRGYEGTSLSDLTEAMGINRPSLYTAFGSKEELFRKALDLYCERYLAFYEDALAEPTSRLVAERLLRETVLLNTGTSTPPGCLGTNGALVCSPESESIRRELVARRTASQDVLRVRFERAKSSGDLPPDADAADLARLVMTMMQGIAVQAASGASRDELLRVADASLRGWPSARSTRKRVPA